MISPADKAAFPPRLVIQFVDDVIHARYPMGSKGNGNYISAAEHNALVSQKDREARAQAFEEVLRLVRLYMFANASSYAGYPHLINALEAARPSPLRKEDK